MKTLLFVICILLGPTLLIFSSSLVSKGKKEIGVHPATIITEYQGNYYWMNRREDPINIGQERRISQEQYDIYNSYHSEATVIGIIGILLCFSSVFFAPSCLLIDRIKYGPYKGYRSKAKRG